MHIQDQSGAPVSPAALLPARKMQRTRLPRCLPEGCLSREVLAAESYNVPIAEPQTKCTKNNMCFTNDQSVGTDFSIGSAFWIHEVKRLWLEKDKTHPFQIFKNGQLICKQVIQVLPQLHTVVQF